MKIMLFTENLRLLSFHKNVKLQIQMLLGICCWSLAIAVGWSLLHAGLFFLKNEKNVALCNKKWIFELFI